MKGKPSKCKHSDRDMPELCGSQGLSYDFFRFLYAPLIDHEKSRCYLLARFKLQNGDQRYLLEIDTSDNRKTMSTRIMGFKAGVEAGKCIDRILRETVKGSLRWPGTMAKYCEPLHSVHHPKESSPGANHARVFDWKQRIRAALG